MSAVESPFSVGIQEMNRDRVLRTFRDEIAAKRPLIGAGAGTGLSAKCSAKGGADLLIVYNSGRFRMAGRPSVTGLLPVGDANQIVLEMGAEILSLRLPVPVFAGVFSSDPFRRMELFLPEIRALGYEGVQNFPTVGLFEGAIRANFEEVGLGFERDVEMVALAARFDLVSAPYVFNADEASRMARAGADIVVANMGTTTSGMVVARTSLSLEESVEAIEAISAAARAKNSSVITLCHGGPIATYEDFQFIQDRCPEVDGFFGASSMERLPTELAIVANTARFKASIRQATETKTRA
jgi:predicted TIM-barrel enzyme